MRSTYKSWNGAKNGPVYGAYNSTITECGTAQQACLLARMKSGLEKMCIWLGWTIKDDALNWHSSPAHVLPQYLIMRATVSTHAADIWSGSDSSRTDRFPRQRPRWLGTFWKRTLNEVMWRLYSISLPQESGKFEGLLPRTEVGYK